MCQLAKKEHKEFTLWKLHFKKLLKIDDCAL